MPGQHYHNFESLRYHGSVEAFTIRVHVLLRTAAQQAALLTSSLEEEDGILDDEDDE